MDRKTAAIILCAGVGSRIGLPPEQNKCAVPIAGTSPVRHCTVSLLHAGAGKITVVVGHAPDSVKNVLKDYEQSGQVTFVMNPYYNRHGCNYSLACGMASRFCQDAERVIIAEGDSMLNSSSMAQLAGSTQEAASLVRSRRYVDYTRSVIAVGEKKKILRYEYDAGHTGQPPTYSEGESIIGDSMQAWSFAGEDLQQLRRLLREYRKRADGGEIPFVHSGVYSINMLKTKIEPVFSEHPDDWINLNTQEDLRKAVKMKWLIK